MTRSIAAAALALALCACTLAQPNPVIRKGDADSVEILYSWDPQSALPLARQHCAQYERVPRLRDAGADIAVFDCVRP